MKIGVFVAAALMADLATAGTTLFRADFQSDKTSARYYAVLTLRYTDLDVAKPAVFIGTPMSGFLPVEAAEITVTPSSVTIRLTDDETARLDRLASNGQTPYLYLRGLRSAGKPKGDEFVEVWALKAKLTFLQIVGKILQVQENYIPLDLDKYKMDPSVWDLRDQFNRAYRVERVLGTEDPGERVLTLRLASMPGNDLEFDLKLDAPLEAAKQVNVVGVKTGAAPEGTKEDPTGKANYYAAALFTSSGGGHPVYGVDARVNQRVYKTLLWSGFFGISPDVAIKANSTGADDENSAHIATAFNWLYPIEHTSVVRSIFISAAPKFETDKDFVNKNGVLDASVTLVAPAYGTRNFSFRSSVNSGTEAGGNIHNSVAQLNGRSILRWKAGADAEAGYDVKRPWLKDVKLTVAFVHRQLFEDELFTKTVTRALPAGVFTVPFFAITVPAGTLSYTKLFGVSPGTRNYLETKLHFGITPNLEFFVSYNHGSLPPLFEAVDKVQTGVAYRLSVP